MIDDARFEELAAEALDSLPERYRSHVAENVEVIVEMWPSEEDLADAGLQGEDPASLLGLYVGVPLIERGTEYAQLPDRIILYQGSILEAAGEDPVAIRNEVRKTVLHEIGHFFGMDHERLDEVGLG
jgi:predicted Zn-dependent protease with MMP-like domain